MNEHKKTLLKKGLAEFKFQFYKMIAVKPDPIHLWDNDDEFNTLIEQILGHTVVDRIKCFMLYQFAKQVTNIQGDAAEIGVYKGGTAKLIANVFEKTEKEIHLFDTFTGMPVPDPEKDKHKVGDFGDTSLEDVTNFLSEYKNVQLHKGYFPATSKPVVKNKFCFVHIDVDIYQSVKDCYKFFYPRMKKGGVMICDDYGFISCPGAKFAVDEFFSDKNEKPIYLPSGQCVCLKL